MVKGKKAKICLLLLVNVLLWIFWNCNQVTLVRSVSSEDKPSYSNKTYSYIAGIYEWGETREAICQEGAPKKIIIKRNFVDSIIHILIGGLVTSRTQEIYCD